MEKYNWIWVTIIGLMCFNSNVLARSPQQVAQGKPQNPVPDFTCPEEFGYFPHPEDCTQYYVCVFGGALLESCTGGLMYSHDLQTCDWPRNVNCGPQGNQSSFVYERTGSVVEPLRQRDYTLNNPPPRPTESVLRISPSQQPTKLTDNSDLIGNVVSTSPKYSDIRFQDDNQADGSRLGRSYEQNVPNYKEEIYASGSNHKLVKRQTHYYGPNPGHDTMYPSSYWRQRDLDFGVYAQQHNRFVKSPQPALSHYGKHRPLQPQRHLHHQTLHLNNNNNHHHRYTIPPMLAPAQSSEEQETEEEQSRQQHSNLHEHHRQQQQQQQPIIIQQQSLLQEQELQSNNKHPTPIPLELESSNSKHPYRHPNHHYSSEEQDNVSEYEPQKQRNTLPLKMYHENVNHRFVLPVAQHHQPQQQRPVSLSPILMNSEPKVELLDGFQPSTYWTSGASEEQGGGSDDSSNGQLTSAIPSNSPLTIDDDMSVNGGSGKTTPAHSQQEIIIDPEYLSQRYAANVQPQPVNNSTANLYYDDSAYYIYDEEKEEPQYDDVDYKTTQQQQQQKPQVIQQQQPVIIQTTTRRPIPVAPTTVKTTSRPSSRGSARHKPSSGNRPTLKPSSTIVKDVVQEVRDVYVDAPTRPLPVYETPVPNTPATKCRKDECVLPDCHCGGKAIPGDLAASSVPQMVLLTFDDSVNDLNKDLYRDLFEKGRKNPNGCPISATFYVSHEWTDYSQVQNLAADGHEIASHSVSHSFGEQFSQKKWDKEIGGQREILAAYGGVKLSEVRGMRAPFLSVGGNNMFKMLYDSNFTYDSSMPVYENKPPSWPYTLDYKLFHDCMIPPCPTKSYPGVWEVPMVMWQDLKGGRCSMGDACSNPPTAEGVYNMLAKNFERHYTTNRAPFGLFYHAAWFTQPHHKEGFEAFLDTLVNMDDVFLVTNYQALQWVRNPTPLSHILNFEPWSCHNIKDRPRRCNHPKVCNLWHKSGVRYMKTCQQCPSQYPWVGNTGVPNTNSL